MTAAKWKILVGGVVTVATAFFAGGATERFGGKRLDAPTLTLDQVKIAFRDELEPIRKRLDQLENRTTINEAELSTYRQRLLPRLDQFGDKLAMVAETVARIDERTRKQ